jgi:hypothetical protein
MGESVAIVSVPGKALRVSRSSLAPNEYVVLALNVSVVMWIALTASTSSPWRKFVPAGIVLTLAVVARLSNRRALFGRFADQLYFLGYLSTITAFLTIAWEVYRKLSGPTEPGAALIPPDIVIFGVAGLSSTVAGLVAMNFLRWSAPEDQADTRDGSPVPQIDWDKLLGAVQSSQEFVELLEAIRATFQLVEQWKGAASNVGTVMKKLSGQINGLGKEIESLGDKTRKMQASAEEVCSNGKEFVKTVEEMRSVLSDYVRITRENLAALEK